MEEVLDGAKARHLNFTIKDATSGSGGNGTSYSGGTGGGASFHSDHGSYSVATAGDNNGGTGRNINILQNLAEDIRFMVVLEILVEM